jgi:PAS domain S-box-containing protein
LVRDQTPYTGPAGETGHYDYIFVPVLDARGRVRAVAGSTRDITEQTQAARQIEDDRRRWRELLAQTPAAIAVLRGPEHTFQWVNPDYARLVGRPAESVLGRTVQEAFPEVEGQVYVDLLNGVYRTGKPFVGYEVPLHLEGSDGPMDLYLNFLYAATRDVDGEIDGVFAHIIDVTDMVEARHRIEQSERQFRTLAETIPHLAWMADEKGDRLWFNRRWFDYTGSKLEEMQGRGWEKAHDPNVLPEVRKLWQQAVSSGEPFEMVHPLRSAEGEFRTFLTRVQPVKDNQGQVVRWFGTNTDITDQRRTEQDLRRMNRELEEFAYVASHDLQEPLRMVNIYTQQILKTLGTDNEALNLYSGFVQQGVVRMEALIHDLLTFSRSVQSEELPTIGTADLQAALSEALSVMKNRIEETGAVIRSSPLPSARGDTAQMAHVFQNVLSNALKYRREGVLPEIQIAAVRDRDHWIVSVRDNGIGFEPRYSERIFGLFKRLHKDEYPGTGLGLAICKRLVERYGGRMWAEGRPDDGATFYFSLPRVAGE